MEIKNCPLCSGKVQVNELFSQKSGVDYSKYCNEYGIMIKMPPLSEIATKYYCTCKKLCFSAVASGDLVAGECYDTEQEAVKVWNEFVTQWNEKLKKVENNGS